MRSTPYGVGCGRGRSRSRSYGCNRRRSSCRSPRSSCRTMRHRRRRSESQHACVVGSQAVRVRRGPLHIGHEDRICAVGGLGELPRPGRRQGGGGGGPLGDPNGPWPRRGGEIGAGTAPPRPPPAPSQAGGAVGRGDRAAERSGRAFRSRRWGRRLKRRGPPAKAVRPPAETARPADEGGMVAGQNGEAPGQEGHARHARRTPARFGKARSGVAGRVTLRWKGMTWQRAR